MILLAEVYDQVLSPHTMLIAGSLLALVCVGIGLAINKWAGTIVAILICLLVLPSTLALDTDLGEWWLEELDYDYPLALFMSWVGPFIIGLALIRLYYFLERRFFGQSRYDSELF